MRFLNILVFLLSVSYGAFSQSQVQDSTNLINLQKENDSVFSEPVLLEEVTISRQKLDPEAKKQYLTLQNRVWRTYPYAKVASDRLLALNKNMNLLKTDREKKKYFKIIENYMENEFSGQLKKLSRKQGQILVKLIHRQTGFTTFDLIKDYKSGWKAFWSNNTAKLFDINLKTTYQPTENNEDYLIECILNRSFDNGRLQNQNAANPVDYNELSNLWHKKAINQNK